MLDYVSIDMYVYVTMHDVHVYDTIQLRTPLLFLLCQLRRLMYLKKKSMSSTDSTLNKAAQP